MAKQKSVFVCESCSYQSLQWIGQCPSCQEWNTFSETLMVSGNSKSSNSRSTSQSQLIKLSEVQISEMARLSSGFTEFDRVLGDGFVAGQVVLLAGEPGIGKSTLLTQLARNFGDKKVLYVCGEESPYQIKLRAQRMNYSAENLYMFSETNSEIIADEISSSGDIDLVIVDSIQTLKIDSMLGVAGSIGQVRESTNLLTSVAKSTNTPMLLIGHVTKEGTVAGPKILEHIVDTVLYLEGDSQHLYRVLRTAKNRFGPVSEIGLFEMSESGMSEVLNPSEIFLNERSADTSGTCITVVMEGFRPLLFEIQALTTKTSFGYPVRTASGFNVNRLKVLIAVLEKRCGLNLSAYDVFINVAGGFKVNEYSVDLAVCLAIISSIKDKALPKDLCAFGEVGLSGEIRKVTHQEKRLNEAKKLGFKNVIYADKSSKLTETLKLFK